MKRTLTVILLLALLLTAAACRRPVRPSGPETPTETAAGTSAGTEPAPETTEAPAARIELPALSTQGGQTAVSDGTQIFFTVDSTDDPNAMDPEFDGLYRAGLSLDSPVRLARGTCRSLWLSGDTLYFYLEDRAGRCSVCAVDKDGAQLRRITEDVEDAESVFMQDGSLYFVWMGSLCRVTDLATGEITTFNPKYAKVLQAQPGPDGQIWLSAQDANDLSVMLYIYDPAEERAWSVIPLGSRFAVTDDGTVYHAFRIPDQPDHEDARQDESIVMKMAPDDMGNMTPTEITGRIAGDLYACGPYLLYTKYVEVEERAGEPEETVRKLFCCDPQTGTETQISRDEFIGWDISIRDVTAGRLFFNVYDYGFGAPGEVAFCDCRSLDLTAGAGETVLNTLSAAAAESPALTADDLAVQEFIEARERAEQEELMNTPYGPGTSSLYLKAGSGSACYRLVRVTGVTEFQVLLGPGEEVTKTFPCGKYILKVARGETWISDEEAFGPEGRYSTTDVFEFEAGASYEISTGTQGSFTGDTQAGFFH